MIDQALSAKIPERIKGLAELSHNIWWGWHPRARDVFRTLNYTAWKASRHNPVEVLGVTSPEQLAAAAADPSFLSLYDSVTTDFETGIKASDTWFSSGFPARLPGPIAYFSMEFALHNSLPIYAGGLGILAGDICKEASDLGLPFVGLGFMYPQGYFHQQVSPEGRQQEVYQRLDFRQSPISPVLSPEGRRCIAQVQLEDRLLSIAVWLVNVGRTAIYLLDTNLDENSEADRLLSARLYTAEPETRIQQEIILGIGGVRVLRALGIRPAVWHANEGHSAFMGLERIREEISSGKTFQSALEATRTSTLFTTHTPVPSGHDVFSDQLMDRYFSRYLPSLEIEREQFLNLGWTISRNRAGFNMTALALNTSSQHNAVSRLHQNETRKMWSSIWPDMPSEDLPIRYVTNGVHLPTWIGFEFTALFEKYLGRDWLKYQDDPALWQHIEDIPDEEIWAVHDAFKRRLIEVIIERAQTRWAEGALAPGQLTALGVLLNPQVLTLGFARRFTEYKRPALILHDLERLKKIVSHPLYPAQIVFAGKSHPADYAGKHILHRVYSACLDRGFQGRLGFIEDYDMLMGRYLTHGVDVWLNTPRRLQEASGTSGMKAAINGVLNLSVRDGWWEEGYNGSNGWAIGAGPEGAGSPDQDKNDAESLYRLLEEEIVPLYYQHDRRGIPHGWIKMIKKSMSTLIPHFCATRMVKEYIQNYLNMTPPG
jgi:glycogen phosphorylase